MLVYRKSTGKLLLLHLLGHTLDLLRMLVLIAVMLQAVELVMLQQDALLDHRLVWLREEVVLLHVHLIWWTTGHFSHVPLQGLLWLIMVVAAALQSFLVVVLFSTRLHHMLRLLLSLTIANLLLGHTRELLGRALLHRVRLKTVHVGSVACD